MNEVKITTALRRIVKVAEEYPVLEAYQVGRVQLFKKVYLFQNETFVSNLTEGFCPQVVSLLCVAWALS